MPIDLEHYEYEYEYLDDRIARRRQRGPGRESRSTKDDTVVELTDDTDLLEGGFEPTYDASRHERVWIENALGPFVVEGVIDDVLRLVKGGKEATVYQCLAHPGLGAKYVAAKVYRPRRFRNLRNDALYREGRVELDESGKLLRDGRALNAIRKGTRIGKAFQHASWVAHEVRALDRLHAAGVTVPKVYASRSNVVLMEWIGGEEVAAPPLQTVDLDGAGAAALWSQLRTDLEAMLSAGIVHGDLSPFNVLFDGERGVIIDLPQAVSPEGNLEAETLFRRDVRRLGAWFARRGVLESPDAVADEIWSSRGPTRIPPELLIPFTDDSLEEDDDYD